jgi:hypothetical protein
MPAVESFFIPFMELPTMPDLFNVLQMTGTMKTAIVGMTKNVGKTVTLNYLVGKFEECAIKTGLVSAGYDGERFDRLTLKDKPRIYAPQGSLVATAKACFDAADAELELLEISSLSTPLGQVYLALVNKAGLVELAGPGSVSGLDKLIDKMAGFGAEHIVVDGAINRIASASPLLTEATILATGASLGPTMDDVIRKTVFRKELFDTLCPADEGLTKAAREALQRGSAALLTYEKAQCEFEAVTAMIPLLAGEQVIESCSADTTALAFGGALVDKNLYDLMQRLLKPPLIIVHDATKIFITPEIYYRYKNQGGSIAVLEPINLIAVTLNPTDPAGRGYDPSMFLERMREVLSPCPVYDLIYEKANITPKG